MAGILPLPIPREGAELARHVEFVRRLARGLVADAATSEDLAQETWVATLERREAPRGSLRAWLARVLRNRAALARRRGMRMAAREAEHPSPHASLPTAELVERTELHGQVVAAVLGLPDGYREIVLRRYFADESTHEIARQLGLPEPTVRTRIARAHERLRGKLEGRFDGERPLMAVALARLAGASPARATPALLSLVSTAALLVMKKTFVALAVVLSALVALWFGIRGRTGDRVPSAIAADASVAPRVSLSAPESPPERAATAEPARSPMQEEHSSVSRPVELPAALPLPGPPAEAETAWLEFHVRDRRGLPVPEAEVRLDCYRTREDRGSSHWIEGMPGAQTDADGVVRLEYPRRLHAYGGPERPEIGSVCYTIEHPDFVTVRETSLAVDESPVQVFLRHGALLIVAGFIGSRSTLLTDVVPHMGDGARIQAADWLPVRDGRLSCNRLPPGRHGLYLTREGEGGTWASAVVEFELAEEEVRELALELHPPRTLLGRLDPLVPRPVNAGEVLLNMHFGRPTDRSGPRGLRLFRAPVRADGSFELAGLPPGEGEMIGMCAGWVSKQLQGDDLVAQDEEPPSLQQVDPAAEGVFVLAMERSARLELQVLGPEGGPVEGAMIRLWPNVQWSNGDSQIFLDRDWQAVTDALGRAEIEDIPAGTESVAVVREGLCLPSRLTPRGVPRRWAEAVQAPGETTTLELRLEPCDGDEGE